jgi:hypothetical protein
MRQVLTVLESPWSEGADVADYSMRPFVEGLALLYDWRLIYRTFTSGEELTRLVEGEAFDTNAGRSLLYVSTHGAGGRLVAGVVTAKYINLSRIGGRLAKGAVEGVWLGACEVGGSTGVQSFLGRGAVWAGGYTCYVDWSTTMLVDIAVLNEVMGARPIRTAARAAKTFGNALSRFNPDTIIGGDQLERGVAMSNGVRLWARDASRRSASEVTQAVRIAAGWSKRVR